MGYIKQQVFLIEVNEKNGVRNQVLKIKYLEVLKINQIVL